MVLWDFASWLLGFLCPISPFLLRLFLMVLLVAFLVCVWYSSPLLFGLVWFVPLLLPRFQLRMLVLVLDMLGLVSILYTFLCFEIPHSPPVWRWFGYLPLLFLLFCAGEIKGIHGWLSSGPADPAGESPGFQARLFPSLETRRRAGGIRLITQTINHGLPFSPVNYLFEIYLFHTINSICFQMLCYSRWVRHVCFGINWPITVQLSNGPWQRSGIAWSHLLLSFTFLYINWPITEGENLSFRCYLLPYPSICKCLSCQVHHSLVSDLVGV